MATTGASLQPIYERLQSANGHHPLGASTFADWSLEAGDMVTLTREGNSYQSPVHTTSMIWRGGSPQISVNSTGNEKREAVTKVSRRKYGRGGAGQRIAGNMFLFETNQNHLLYEVYDKEGKFSQLEVDLDGLHHTVAGQGGQISILENTSRGFRTRIEKVVDENGTIKSAEICTAINNDNSSQAMIQADKILLLGETIADTVSASFISARMAAIPTLNVNNVVAKSIKVPVGGSGAVSSVATETYVNGSIYGLRVQQSGNSYYLQKQALGSTGWQDIPGTTFSRAITSWSVAGGSGKITVNAQPQNQNKSVTVFVYGPSTITSNGTRAYNVYYKNDGGSDVLVSGTTLNVSVDVGGSASDILLGSASYTYARPSGTSLSSFRSAIMSAVENRCFFRFKATLDGGSGEKWYYVDFE